MRWGSAFGGGPHGFCGQTNPARRRNTKGKIRRDVLFFITREKMRLKQVECKEGISS
jgi:hypothetical protein